MKKMLLTLSLMAAAVPATMLVAPSTAHAGNCGSVASVTSDIWTEYNSLASQLPYVDKIDAMIKFWNSMSGNSWSKIGPRRLDYSSNLNGTVVGPTSRVFIAEIPSDKNSVEVKLDKLDGRAKTSITVCKVSKTGKVTKLWDFTASNGSYTKTWKKTISGVQDEIVTVNIVGHSATNKFKYRLRATKK
jgi:hypothetical protein